MLQISKPDLEQPASAECLFAATPIQAGFPIPSEDDFSDTLDLNRLLVQHPAATFFARVKGDSMIEAGVEAGDILIVDRALEPRDGSMAVCFIDGEFTLKFIELDKNEKNVLWLKPANNKFAPIKITPESDFKIWGIVSYIIKNRMRK